MVAPVGGPKEMAMGRGGGDMRLYEARITLKSPAVITGKRTQRGFVKPLDHVPGSMLRGAIVTALYRQGAIKSFEEEGRNPSILASPAYPLAGGERFLPASPFMWKCEEKGTIIDLTRHALEILEKGEINISDQCGSPPRPIYATLIGSKTLKEFDLRSFRATSVGIDKVRRAGVKGMLYDYEAIAEGTQFWAFVYGPESLEGQELEIFLGRGSSRGFGMATIRFAPFSASYQDVGPYIALSPVVPLKEITWNKCTLRVSRITGRTTELQAGWDYLKNTFRPTIQAAKRGSIVEANVEGECGALLYVGLPLRLEAYGDSILATGLNALIPLKTYYDLRGG